jgi:hypothetical protein
MFQKKEKAFTPNCFVLRTGIEQNCKRFFPFIVAVFLLSLNSVIISSPQSETETANRLSITSRKQENDFTLSESGKSAPLCFSSQDYAGVLRVGGQLQTDINNVTNAQPAIVNDKIPDAKEFVLIGTLGKNPLIDDLIKNKKLDVADITGKWETFVIQVVEKPFANVDRALVIVGSDKRGTIYGIYQLSEQIGVSPWYWWADVPVKKSSSIYIEPKRFSLGEPKVKYRGIFINDEAPALSGWVTEKFGGFNSKFYEHVFELILRLKGNFLWPAMWGRMFYVEDTLNAKLADEYGVVISTSHHEPMMRAHAEWQNFGKGKWNYEQNETVLKEFWREGIKRMGNNESIITLAMRGDGDEAMGADANVSLLQKIVEDQRKIITEVTGKDPATIPQVWALYKEVQEYYDKGMRVPDDVTLLLCDDNWGNLRKLPKLDDKPRKGGYGIYYHFDYVGGPRNYKWLNTNQIERTWEQMHLAYEYGAKQIWVVNVGDIKPMEFPIQFFLDYAWNPENITGDKLPEYVNSFAEQQFGEKYSKQIADILNKYTKYNSRCKPELLSTNTYSLVNYREADRVVADYNRLVEEAQKINNELPEEYRDAYFQLVLHPVIACANMNELIVTAAKNFLYAKHGRASTNSYAAKVKELFEKDAEITALYNKGIANGKWNHMMDQTHIGYSYWQQPDSNIMPPVKEIELAEDSEMGVSIEGSSHWWPMEKAKAILPEFDSFNRQVYYIDVFNRGKKPFEYSLTTSEPWVLITPSANKVDVENRLLVSIDWAKVPVGKHSAQIKITAPDDRSVLVNAVINNYSKAEMENVNGFTESNNYVSMEAEHYSRAINNDLNSWLIIPNLGRTLSAVTAMPVTTSIKVPGEKTPHLEYDVFLFNQGDVKVKAYFSPSLNFNYLPDGIRYAISFDDEQPQLINMTTNPNPPDLNRDQVWNKWMTENINIVISNHKIDKPGKHVLKFWLVDPGVVLQKIVIETGDVKPSYLGPPESFNVK